MNADRLLAHHERIADAPDAVARLRRFILNLAVRGKLVPQDPNEEPASEFLKRIAAEKARLIKAGKVTKVATMPSPLNGEPRYPTPTGWTWTTLGSVSNVVMGQSPPGDTYNTNGEGIPLINGPVEFTAGPFGRTVVNQYTTAPTNYCEEGNLLICVRGSTTGRTNVAGFRACIGRGVAAIQPYFEDTFVRLFIWNERDSIIEMGRGIAFPSISRKQIEDLALPLPSLAEQRRIVAKVDELMALCDRLEAARFEREATRDRLAMASFARLNAPDPDPAIFADHARFALNNLASFTTRPDQIKQIRQSILNLAVRGRLVRQDPNDEPGLQLLTRIAADKEASVKQKRAVEADTTARYDVPKSWTWTTLEELVVFGPQNGISPKPTLRMDAPKAITLTATTSGAFNPNHFKHVEASIPPGSEFWLRQGDLLFQRGNTRDYVGIAAVYEGPSNTFLYPDLIMKVRLSKLVNLRFVHLCAVAPTSRAYFAANASGAQATMPKINQGTLGHLPIPLPPVAEQHRIVAKVDELMAQCDWLEASLASAKECRQRLLETVLRQTLAPRKTTAMEAVA